MGKIVYLTGMTVKGRQDLLIRELSRRNYPSFLYLLSTRGKVIEQEGEARFWLRGWVDTLSGLIRRIFDSCLKHERFSTFQPLDEGLRLQLVKKVVEDRAVQPDGLSYLHTLLSASDKEPGLPGIYRSLSSFFSLLIKNNQQDRLAEELGKWFAFDRGDYAPANGQHGLESDLIWLFGDYEELKRQINAYDEDDIIRSVRDYLQENKNLPCFADREIMVLDNPIHFTRIEEDILENLFHRVKEVWWLIDDYSAGEKGFFKNQENLFGQVTEGLSTERPALRDDQVYDAFRLFRPVYAFINHLGRKGFEQQIKKTEKESLPHPLARSLFGDNRPVSNENKTMGFRFFSGRVAEVKAIASEIKKINYENNLETEGGLGRIRVIFPRLQDYASIISEVFYEYGIPFSLTRGLPLAAHPLSGLFLNMMKIPLDSFDREDVFHLFTRDYMGRALSCLAPERNRVDLARAVRYPLVKEDLARLKEFYAGETEDQKTSFQEEIFLLERVCRRCRIKKLQALVTGREEGEILRIREVYRQSISHEQVFQEGEDLKREYYWFLSVIDSLQVLLKPLVGLMDQSDPYKIKESFFALLRLFHFPDILLDLEGLSSSFSPDEANRLVKRDVKAFNFLNSLMVSVSRELVMAGHLFGIKRGRELLTEFYSLFRSRLQFSYLYDERNPNVVSVSEWLEIRGRSFDYIFAGGLTADQFPLKEETNFIFSGSTNLPFRQLDAVEQSKYLFSHLLRNYVKRLYLSCPHFIDEKETQPTPILFDLKALLAPELSGDDNLRDLEEILKWENNIYYSSENELYSYGEDEVGVNPERSTDFRIGPRVVVKNESRKEGIIRGINLFFSRLAEEGLFEYDGQVGKAKRFQDYLMTKSNIFSPSQLDLLANCPMRYLFERLYDLQALEEPGEELTPREMGIHLHSILRRLFDRLKAMGVNAHDLGLSGAFALAREIGEDHFERFILGDQFPYLEYQKDELLLGLDRDPSPCGEDPTEREGLLACLLRFENTAFKERLPRELEYAFGFKKETLVSLGRSFIKGYIDRFDIDKQNSDCVYVYDYKTGQTPSLESVKKGLSLQLPAYMAALKQLTHFRQITAVFYSLRLDKLKEENPLEQVLRERMDDNKGLDMSGVQIIDRFVDRLLDLTEQGSFHHSVDELRCGFCDFKYACFRDNRRMAFLINRGIEQAIYGGEKNMDQWQDIDAFSKKLKEVNRSIKKISTLKTEQARQKHMAEVRSFAQWIEEKRAELPFSRGYIDQVLGHISRDS